MSWGTGPWGAGSPWGSTLATAAPPTLAGVASATISIASSSSPAVVDRLGGTVITLLGSGFTLDATVEIYTATLGVVAYASIVRPELDVVAAGSKIYAGCPALEPGTYGVRVVTPGGSSELADAIAAREFADAHKIVSVRGKWAPRWATGPRILHGGAL